MGLEVPEVGEMGGEARGSRESHQITMKERGQERGLDGKTLTTTMYKEVSVSPMGSLWGKAAQQKGQELVFGSILTALTQWLEAA